MPKAFRTTCLTLIMMFLAFSLTTIGGCKKEKMVTDGSATVNFSEDTILFDTVFTTIGSTTQYFKVYNPHNGILRISDLYIESGLNSNFRLNVDGVPGKSFSDVEIGPKDSIFIFVEVTVDPNSGTSPLVISDKIIFKTNGNTQHVDLVAWGQDAYFFRPGHGSNAFLMPCNATLLTDKPNVFYGFGIVGENCCLTIPAGAKLHFHPGSGLIVFKGCLNMTGTASDPVVLQGDRLEYDYREIAGQWEGVRFIQPKTSLVEHALIKNGFYGLWADTTFSNTELITINKTEIRNMASIGIYGNAGARIKATNSLVKNCGLYGLALTYGGDFTFNHCTFGNYWTESTRTTPNFYFKNWFTGPAGDNIRDVNLTMDNCIVYGNLENEFETDIKTGSVLNYVFRNCFIRSDQDLSDGTHYISLYKNVDPNFVNTGSGDLKINAVSACRGAANTLVALPDDIEDHPRDGSPDVGCYEYQ